MTDDFIKKYFWAIVGMMVLFFIFMVIGALAIDIYRYGWGQNIARDHAYYGVNSYSVLQVYAYANKELSPEDKIIMYFDNGGYYLSVPYVVGDPAFNTFIDYDNITTPGLWCEAWENIGVSHVLVGKDWSSWESEGYDQNFGTKRLLILLGSTLTYHAQTIAETEHHILFKINEECG